MKYIYCELHIPDTGMTLSGAIDSRSLDKIIDTIMSAEVDREDKRESEYTRLQAENAELRKSLQMDKTAFGYILNACKSGDQDEIESVAHLHAVCQIQRIDEALNARGV